MVKIEKGEKERKGKRRLKATFFQLRTGTLLSSSFSLNVTRLQVMELEDQLKMVSLQRRRAEKATADVLAILESNGVSDASEDFDSNSEGETTISDSKVSSHTSKKKGASSDFEVRRRDIDTYSSSEVDSSPSTGRSLSWKSGKDSSNYLERKKFMDPGRRRSSSFTSNSSLPKRVGKSCRRIRRKETRSVCFFC